MLKKIMMVATAVAALFAVGAQAASAEWYDKGVALTGAQHPTLNLAGSANFNSPNGGVDCPNAEAEIQATGGSTDGHVLKFGVANPTACTVTGGLVFLGGSVNSLKKVELTGTLTATPPNGKPTLGHNGEKILITRITLHNEFHSGFKLTLSTIGHPAEAETPITATPDNTTAITKATLGGELTSAIGKVTVSGTLNVLAPNIGTYGIVK